MNHKSHSKTEFSSKKRIVWLSLIIFLFQIVIVARYGWVQIVWSPQLQKLAKEQWTSDIQIPAKRGQILDKNGKIFAMSGNAYRVDASLRDLNNAIKNGKASKEAVAEKLAPILNLSKENLLALLNKKMSSGLPALSVTVARGIDKSQGDKIKELKLPGILVLEDTKRYYPNDNMASQVLGNTNVDGKGRAGIELKYDKELSGTPGRFIGETDPAGREIPDDIPEYESPKNGDDLTLTIDENIQFIVEKALEQGLSKYKAKRASAIVMDPKTGEILAMANKPDYNPNSPIQGTVENSMALWSNRMVNESFEPGSIMKIITAAAAIDAGVVKDSDTFKDPGYIKVANRTIHCWEREGHGIQTFPQILQNSCNVGFTLLGQKIGKETLNKYFEAFGFTKKTGIDYPGEAIGIVKPLNKVGPVELATESFGQGISVTGIQYIAALGAIANDGKMVEPHLVKRITYTDDEGNTSVVKDVKPKVVKQVVSPETAKHIRNILEGVVTDGVAKNAYIEGYHIGGKTGTAQKIIGTGYAPGKYISSFASMAPVNDPKIVMLVSIDEPDPSNYYAGSTVAPLAKQIYEDIFRYLNMQPDKAK